MPSTPSYRGLRLDGPVEEFHRAIDRLRWTPLPLPSTTRNLRAHPRPTRRRRYDPSDGQAALCEEAS